MGVFSYLLLRSSGHCCIYLRTQQKEQRLLNLCWFIYEWGVSEHFSCCLSAKFASHKSQNKVLNREERRRRRKEKKRGEMSFVSISNFAEECFLRRYIFSYFFSLSLLHILPKCLARAFVWLFMSTSQSFRYFLKKKFVHLPGQRG